MQSRITQFSRAMERLVPDAISACVLMMIVLAVLSLFLGNSAGTTLDAYYRGLWMLLPFTMQMTLIIVLSAVLGSTPFFRKSVQFLSRLPTTPAQVVALSVLVAAVLSYAYWGLGIALGPLVAVYFAREAERKGIQIDFLFLLAAVLGANSVWQYGLSASAPLLMATPGHFLESTTGIMPLSTTIWTPAALAHEIVFIVAVIVAARLLMPSECRPLSEFPDAFKLAEQVEQAEAAERLTYSQRLERSAPITIVLCAALVGWLYQHFAVKGLSLDINSLNSIFLLLCLLLHRNVYGFTRALQRAVVSCWPVIVIYHLYAGVAGLIQYTTVGEWMAGMVASFSTRYSFPLIAAISGTIIAIFIPSSGGQWVVQGFVTAKAAGAVGVTVQRGMLALGVGDQMGNLISPFWYVIVAGVARVDFRRFFGYGLIFATLWFVIGILSFTFLPC